MFLNKNTPPKSNLEKLTRSNLVKWIGAGFLLLCISLLMSWVASGFENLQDWGAFLILVIFAAGLLWLGIFLLSKENIPRWLIYLVLAGALLRLISGAVWMVALPIWGHGTQAEKAGYIMADAWNRDQQAWKLAQSSRPLESAFSNNRGADQYGGLLFLSAGIYRYTGTDKHQPLLIILITASVSALAIAYTWAFSKRAWGEQAGKLAAWIVALFPDAILLGGSQMREAFTITLGIIAFYGLLGYLQERKATYLAWLVISLLLYLPFSPPFAAMLIGMLTMTAILGKLSKVQYQLVPRHLWLAIAGLGAFALAGLWLTLRQFTPPDMHNPIEMLGWWFQKSANLQAVLSQNASGWLQKTFKLIPTWTQLPLLIGYGVLQPFLPAALVVGSHAPIWPWITATRSVGWTAILLLLIYSPFLAFRRNREYHFARVINLVVWIGILIASFRGGGDMWDNPRYRTAFLGIQASLAAWTWLEHKRIGDPWLRRFCLGMIAIFAWFVPWYLRRYYGFAWPIGDLFKTIGAGVVCAVLIVFWDWVKSYKVNQS